MVSFAARGDQKMDLSGAAQLQICRIRSSRMAFASGSSDLATERMMILMIPGVFLWAR